MSPLPPDQSLVRAALAFATKAHAGQMRKDKRRAYIEHPIAVMDIFARRFREDWYHVLPWSAEYVGQAVAATHDVLEDTSFTESDMRAAGLGNDVILPVRALTHAPNSSYLAYLLHLRQPENLLAKLVKLCDIAHNRGDLEFLPSAAARKALRTKYELATYILTQPSWQ